MIDYQAECMAFQMACMTDKLAPSAKCLWYALLNLTAEHGWVEGYIGIPLITLQCYAGLSKDTLMNARNVLKNKGLIDFKGGSRNAASAQYKMIFLTGNVQSENQSKKPTKEGVWSENQSKFRSKPSTNTSTKPSTNIPTKTPPFIFTREEDDIRDEGYDVEEDNTTTRDNTREGSIANAFFEGVGRAPYPAEVNMLMDAGRGMDTAVICRAINGAAANGASSPARYAAVSLNDWCRYGIATEDDLDEYEEDTRIVRSKDASFECVQQAMRRLDDMREKAYRANLSRAGVALCGTEAML